MNADDDIAPCSADEVVDAIRMRDGVVGGPVGLSVALVVLGEEEGVEVGPRRSLEVSLELGCLAESGGGVVGVEDVPVLVLQMDGHGLDGGGAELEVEAEDPPQGLACAEKPVVLVLGDLVHLDPLLHDGVLHAVLPLTGVLEQVFYRAGCVRHLHVHVGVVAPEKDRVVRDDVHVRDGVLPSSALECGGCGAGTTVDVEAVVVREGVG